MLKDGDAMRTIDNIKNEQLNLAEKIYIFDTTLRDGEQTPGVALTVEDKIQIAQKLNNLGVDKIEVGFPASSQGEIESARKIRAMDLDSTIVGLSRSLKGDIDKLIDSNLDYVHLFIGTSPLHRDYKLKMSMAFCFTENGGDQEYYHNSSYHYFLHNVRKARYQHNKKCYHYDH